jgi:hypothetical protein
LSKARHHFKASISVKALGISLPPDSPRLILPSKFLKKGVRDMHLIEISAWTVPSRVLRELEEVRHRIHLKMMHLALNKLEALFNPGGSPVLPLEYPLKV